MPAKRHSAEQIVRKLREAEVELARGATVKDACRKLAITEHTYYRWRREYGGLRVDQARRLKQQRSDVVISNLRDRRVTLAIERTEHEAKLPIRHRSTFGDAAKARQSRGLERYNLSTPGLAPERSP